VGESNYTGKRSPVAVPVILLAVLIGSARAASGQTAGAVKWEVEVHGGRMFSSTPVGGTASLPAPGQSFTTTTGLPTRVVPSWFFGDGAALLNQARFANRLQFTALDSALARPLTEHSNGVTLGARISRVLNARLTAEFSFDYSAARREITPANLTAIEASRASFVAVWNEHWNSASFYVPMGVTAVVDVSEVSPRQVVSTGAVSINLRTRGRLIPYATVGGGVLSRFGDLPGATIVGNYRLLFSAFLAPINETDSATVREDRASHALGLFGGGVRWHASPRWGVRFDAREQVSANTTRTLVDANPTAAPGLPMTVFPVSAFPPTVALQFSTIPAIRSSLSGPALAGYEAFRGSGLQSHFSVSAGLFWRF
jgi:hypothetical protein